MLTGPLHVPPSISGMPTRRQNTPSTASSPTTRRSHIAASSKSARHRMPLGRPLMVSHKIWGQIDRRDLGWSRTSVYDPLRPVDPACKFGRLSRYYGRSCSRIGRRKFGPFLTFGLTARENASDCFPAVRPCTVANVSLSVSAGAYSRSESAGRPAGHLSLNIAAYVLSAQL